ncbi:hypothetical protein AVEN_68318-1 [Araneus ventricosus]|uniref:Uncharacterized protein n=1 Tax=Araneus ventricosus TaxID=182803 RepID=A0A4Y2P1H8_ARAVE|nr:hypothetical protein AVEN_68318-1 [Araneus ventricosus]
MLIELAAVFTSLSEKELVPDKCFGYRNSHLVPNMGCMGVAPDFPRDFFLSFARSMGPDIVVQEDETITLAWAGFQMLTYSLPIRNDSRSHLQVTPLI